MSLLSSTVLAFLLEWQHTRPSVQREFSAKPWRLTAQCHNSFAWHQENATLETHLLVTGAAGRWTSKKKGMILYIGVNLQHGLFLINFYFFKNSGVKFRKDDAFNKSELNKKIKLAKKKQIENEKSVNLNQIFVFI